MTYFKSLLFNFLTVFFVNHMIPGVDIIYYTKLPSIEGDIIFAFALGLLNSLIFPVMHFFKFKPSYFKIGFVAFLISFAGYALINLFPLGVNVKTPGAFIWSGLIVWFASYLTNHLELRAYHIRKDMKEKEEKIFREKKEKK